MRDPESELGELDAAHLRRRLRQLDGAQGASVSAGGTALLNFSSNDYLGLASHPTLKQAFASGIDRFGTGSGSSRLVCGSLAPHHDFEEALAAAKGTEGALLFSSGFAAAVGAIPALAGPGDLIVMDKLCHASLIDGARLSGATIRIFPHQHLEKLERLLRSAREKLPADARVLVITESVFSMDGDLAPLREIVELKERHGALLLLDEAHGFGVLGPHGMGLAEAGGIDGVDFHLGTLSKAAGLAGGYLAARRAFIDLLVNRARSFVFSTAPPPALACAALAALDLIRGAEGALRRQRLHSHGARLAAALGAPAPGAAILPLVLGDAEAALAAAAALQERGFLIPAIRFPTVPKDSARLRFTLSASHQNEDVAALAAAVRAFLNDPAGQNPSVRASVAP